MKKYIKHFLIIFFLALTCGSSKAGTYMIPGVSGLIDLTYDDCLLAYYSGYAGALISGGSTCDAYFYIKAVDGDVLTSVTFYYKDTSGSQDFYASIMENEVDSLSGATTMLTYSSDDATVTDTSTSSSIQSKTISIYSYFASDTSYIIYVSLDSGTALMGITIDQ